MLPILAFLTLKVPVAIDFHFMNHQGARFQLNIFFTVLLKKGIHLHCAWPEGEKINIYIFTANYPFKRVSAKRIHAAINVLHLTPHLAPHSGLHLTPCTLCLQCSFTSNSTCLFDLKFTLYSHPGLSFSATISKSSVLQPGPLSSGSLVHAFLIDSERLLDYSAAL